MAERAYPASADHYDYDIIIFYLRRILQMSPAAAAATAANAITPTMDVDKDDDNVGEEGEVSISDHLLRSAENQLPMKRTPTTKRRSRVSLTIACRGQDADYEGAIGGSSNDNDDTLGNNKNKTNAAAAAVGKANTALFVVGALGVVFGDIGTSPLYTLNTITANIPIFEGDDLQLVNRSEIVVAVYCLIFYSLIWIVMIKYIVWVMRVNHDGSGGELAMAQVILMHMDQSRPPASSPPSPPQSQLQTQSSRSASGEYFQEKKKKKENNELPQNTSLIHATNALTPPPGDRNIHESDPRKTTIIMTLAIISASFIIGDGVITPPNTVLGALYSPVLANISTSLNVFISIMILVLTFSVQRYGSKVIGYVNGPIMLLWFAALAGTGLIAIVRYPEEARFLLRAFNPACLTAFAGNAGTNPPIVGFQNAFLSLAGVILCVTGAEALYADLGHFGYRAIVVAWSAIVFPALAIQYFGQCCYIISLGRDETRYPSSDYETAEYQALLQERELFNTQLIVVPGNLVYALVPTDIMSQLATQSCLWLLTILAVLASIIASQALISGMYTILNQAYALDLVPRMTVTYTNPNEKGQVFISEANIMMCAVCVLIVLLFQTSEKLLSAYGISVAICMFATDILMGFVMSWVWKFHWTVVVICSLPFVFVDVLYLSSNCIKLSVGPESWTSIIIAVLVWYCMQAHWWTKTTVKRAARVAVCSALERREGEGLGKECGDTVPLQTGLTQTTSAAIDDLLSLLKESELLKRMPVAGVFLTSLPQTYPPSLSILARSMAALPETIILLNIAFSHDKPYVDERERYDLQCHSEVLGVYSLNLYFGYCEPVTAESFDVNNSLMEIFESESYIALQKLADVNCVQKKETALLAPFEESLNERSPDSSHPWTYILGVRKYIPHEKENGFSKLFVYTCDFLTRNSKASRDFFGLSSFDTIEVSCVTTISLNGQGVCKN